MQKHCNRSQFNPMIALAAFARTRWLSKQLNSQTKIEKYQNRKLKHYLKHTIPKVEFYKGAKYFDLSELPIIDKKILSLKFNQFNRSGINETDVRHALAQGEAEIEGYAIGHSTGTSGNRGYYVISDKERFVWLGTILAKTLPDVLYKKHKVALVLPYMASLYNSATTTNRLDIQFFDLNNGIETWQKNLTRYAPDTLIAPPKVLRHLADRNLLNAEIIFSSAEVLDKIDKEVIEHTTRKKLREIYMATEGLLGVSCKHGTIHLAEDVVKFEWEKTIPNSSLCSPIITDFTRKTQIMARYRMNDLITLSSSSCSCGSVFQAVERIDGRQDDIFYLPSSNHTLKLLTPDVLRNTLLDCDSTISDFRITQVGATRITIKINDDADHEANGRAQTAFSKLFSARDINPVDIIVNRGIETSFSSKLRRVKSDWRAPPKDA